jgi:NTE family protein
LGAFGCGVFKAIEKHGFNLDIVAGTSIGGINAAIIAGTKEKEDISRKLEEFWIELSEGFIQINPIDSYSEFGPFKNFESIFFPQPINNRLQKYSILTKEQQARVGQITSFISSATFGNSKFFLPR